MGVVERVGRGAEKGKKVQAEQSIPLARDKVEVKSRYGVSLKMRMVRAKEKTRLSRD